MVSFLLYNEQSELLMEWHLNRNTMKSFLGYNNSSRLGPLTNLAGNLVE